MPMFALRLPAPFKPLRYALMAVAVFGLTACIEGEPLDISRDDALDMISDPSEAGGEGVEPTEDVSADTSGGTGEADSTPDAIAVTGATITLDWEKPLSNVDGTLLIDLAGYRIHWGTAPGVYTQSIDVTDPDATRLTMDKPAPGTYYFSASAYDSDANEGPRSNMASVVVN